MENIIIIAILVVIIGLAFAYIIKAKKSGVKCIGCPNAGSCGYRNGKTSSCNCSGNTKHKSECNCYSKKD